jgi:acetoacetyl-CoA synthetase
MTSGAEDRTGVTLRRADRRGRSGLDRFRAFVAGRRGTRFAGYEDLWQWSVSRPGEFWQDIWDFFDVKYDGSYSQVVSDGPMWTKRWFSGARLNYAEHACRGTGGSLQKDSRSPRR